MSKILPIILVILCFVVAGCEDEKKEFEVGDKVCLLDGVTVGTVSFVEEWKSEGYDCFTYHVSIRKEELNGCIIYKMKSNQMNKFVEDPR